MKFWLIKAYNNLIVIFTVLSVMNIVLTTELPINNQKEVFVVDLLEDDDDELIKKEDLEKIGLEIKEHLQFPTKKLKKINKVQVKPKHLLQFYINYKQEEINNINLKRVKRQTNSTKSDQSSETDQEYYNYEHFRKEYYEEVSKEYEEMNETANLGPEQKHNSIKEAVDVVTDVKVPKNCTDKDRAGYGLRSIECLFKDMFSSGLNKSVRSRLKTICIFWFLCYLVIAIPLWLIKGWCCCCCRCKFCFPKLVLYEVKQYIVKNPPGVEELPNGTTKNYKPTDYEISLFQSLEISTFKH